MPFKPMLAFSKLPDLTKVKFPVLASKKLDGIRATVQGGRLLSRSLKPIPNVNVQAMFMGLPEGLDGELILGDPCSPSAYRDTVSVVMSDDKDATGIIFHVFDKHGDAGFSTRLGDACAHVDESGNAFVQIVQHVLVNSIDELETLETAWLEAGNEGVMLRAINGRYKEGRSSEIEGLLLKVKRFVDSEAEIVGVYEQERNDNVAFKNELGRTARSSAKGGKVAAGVLGGLAVIGLNGDYNGVEFSVGTGFDATQRESLWREQESLVGQIIKLKYFPSGAKDRPRHPVFLGFRDARDMS